MFLAFPVRRLLDLDEIIVQKQRVKEKEFTWSDWKEVEDAVKKGWIRETDVYNMEEQQLRILPINMKQEQEVHCRPDIPNFLFDFSNTSLSHGVINDNGEESSSRYQPPDSADELGTSNARCSEEIIEEFEITQIKSESEDTSVELADHSFHWDECRSAKSDSSENEKFVHFQFSQYTNFTKSEVRRDDNLGDLLYSFSTDKEAMLHTVKFDKKAAELLQTHSAESEESCGQIQTLEDSRESDNITKENLNLSTDQADCLQSTSSQEAERDIKNPSSECSGLTEKEIDSEHKCTECNKVFSTAFKLKKHYYLHSDQQQFQCEKCDKKFMRHCSLKNHMRSHTGVKLQAFQCSVCNGNFTTKYSLMVHVRIHTGERPYHCDKCPAKFVQTGDLTVHKRIHTGEKPYFCEICKMQFAASSRLRKHIRVVHQGIKPHQCNLCGSKFSSAGHLATHIKSHTGEKPYVCEFCKKSFSETTKLRIHLRSHTGDRPYECKVCSARFARTTILSNHMAIHTGLKQFSCEHCPARFSSQSTWLVHTRRHLGLKNYVCKECDARFVDSQSLKLHMRTHTGEKPYACVLCAAKFTTSGNMRKHTRIHLKLKPYECEQCARKFSTKANLDVHVQRHLGIKPHSCDKCERCFTQVGDLKKHLRVHSGERPYGCCHCEAKFASMQNLKRHVSRSHPESNVKNLHPKLNATKHTQVGDLKKHLRVHSGERPYGCCHCEAKFASMQNLKRHVSRSHPESNVKNLHPKLNATKHVQVKIEHPDDLCVKFGS